MSVVRAIRSVRVTPDWRRLIACVLMVIALLGAVGCTETAKKPVDPPAIALAGRVTDKADLLTDAEEDRLTATLAALERDKGHQFVVVTTPSLNGQSIERFTIALARAWGIGRIGYNDGVVLLVAPHERKARIEVGRGLEAKLTDAICRGIMERDIIPRVQEGDMPAGIIAGVDAIDRRLRSGSALTPQR